MQYKIALKMIQDVVQRKDDANDEETFVDGGRDVEEVVEKPDAKIFADDFLRDRKR